MKQLGEFTLKLSSKREMPVEILTDNENTIIVIDCRCCEEYLSRRLPGGVLIPIASALKTFFGDRGMRNIDVNVSGIRMRRTYKGLMDDADVLQMIKELEKAVTKFTRKKKV
jgi:rhodanese-related sulfurtransferase